MNEDVLKLIETGMENLRLLDPKFNPIKGHTFFDAPEGSSRFRKIFEHIGDIQEWIKGQKSNKVILTTGRNGAACLQLWFDDVVGERAVTAPFPDKIYTIKRDHGDLVATGKAKFSMRLTYVITFVFTPEDVEGKKLFCLASVYPGKPDQEGNWTDLKEGDEIPGSELIRRNISRVKDI